MNKDKMEIFKINPNLNIDQLRLDFKMTQAVIIEDFLETSSANMIYDFLTNHMPEDWWYTSYRIPSLSEEVQMIRRTPENIDSINKIYPTAYNDFRDGHFSYIFDRSVGHVEGCYCLECKYREFLQQPQFKKLVKQITGLDISMNGEIFASRYTAGQFLSPHHDIDKGYLNLVYSLSKDWKPQWGGNLYLLEDDWTTIKQVVLSSYNRLALTLMNSPDKKKVGIPHFVSQVASGVTVPRLSITGWIS